MKRLTSLAAFAILSAPLLTLTGSAAEKMPLQDAVIGSWTITAAADHYQDGKVLTPWGQNVAGNLSFDKDGRFTWILLGDADPQMKSDDPRRPDALLVAYYGSYKLNPADNSISYHIERAANSARNGADQSLTVSMNGDRISFVGSERRDQHGMFKPHLEAKRAGGPMKATMRLE